MIRPLADSATASRELTSVTTRITLVRRSSYTRGPPRLPRLDYKELPLYYCGCRDLAHLLASAHLQTLDETHTHEQSDFALPGDRPAYAPDRPADVQHVDLNLALDFEERAIHGNVTTTFTALFEEVREITFDAAELAVEAVTLASGEETDGNRGGSGSLDFWTEGEKLHVHLDRPYRHGETFAIGIRYCAQPRVGLTFVAPLEG